MEIRMSSRFPVELYGWRVKGRKEWVIHFTKQNHHAQDVISQLSARYETVLSFLRKIEDECAAKDTERLSGRLTSGFIIPGSSFVARSYRRLKSGGRRRRKVCQGEAHEFGGYVCDIQSHCEDQPPSPLQIQNSKNKGSTSPHFRHKMQFHVIMIAIPTMTWVQNHLMRQARRKLTMKEMK